MQACIECFIQGHDAASGFGVAAQQPLGMLVVILLALYALLTLARRVVDRVDPPPVERRPLPIEVPPPPRVWRFPEPGRRRI